jgi:pimeloyl-ACP methyl ester carboxylesterase
VSVAVRLATRSWGPGDDSGGADDGPGAGSGGPLALLIHGVTSSSRTWWRVAPELVRRGYRVLAIDLRGHGASPGMGEGLALGDLTADVLETLRADGTYDDGREGRDGQATVDLVVGHSLGALVALDLLGRVPGLARRLVLEEPPGSTGVDGAAMADGVEADGHRARAEPDAMRQELAASNPAWDPEEVERRLADLAACDTEGVAAGLRGTTAFDLPALATAVRIPTLLVVGLEDLGSALVGPDRKALVDALAGRGAFEVLDAGHNLHREAFGRFMDVLDRWLDATAAAGKG